MIELIFSVCFIDDPKRCREERLSFFQTAVSPRQCMMMGQIEISKWMDAHPNYELKKWACRPAGQIAKI